MVGLVPVAGDVLEDKIVLSSTGLYWVMLKTPHYSSSSFYFPLRSAVFLKRCMCWCYKTAWQWGLSQKSGQFLTLGGIILIKLLTFWLKIYPTVHGCYDFCWSHLALCKLWQVFVLEEVMWGSWSLVSSWLLFFRSLDRLPGWRKRLARAAHHQPLWARELQGVLLRKAPVLKRTLIPSTE